MKTIAFQGTTGANSHLACQKFYPELFAKPFASFLEIFEAVENEQVEYAMIPLENSYAGRVSEIHNLLQNSSVSIVAEHFFPIIHNLAALKGSKLEDLKEVFSHPQALMQCQKNLRALGLKINESSNTAEAAKFVAKTDDKTKAAICSKHAAKISGLQIIQENLQDLSDNVTTFITIAKSPINPNPEISPVITTLLFTIKNTAGSLYKALGSFANNEVNMIKLESYIPGGFSEEAKFFITIDGHPKRDNVSSALQELKNFSKETKLLGIYYADKSRSSKP